jgi:hypothetical protein
MNKADAVIYIDSKSREHLALVTAVNAFNPDHLSLAYIDLAAEERENVVQVADVPYMEDASKQETNPDLPTIHLNCWKARYEIHTEPAPDHPMFDHPFAPKPTDEEGRVIEPSRPEHDAMVAAHVGDKQIGIPMGDFAFDAAGVTATSATAGLPSGADLDADAAEKKAADDTAK